MSKSITANDVNMAFRLLRAELLEIQNDLASMNFGVARDKLRQLESVESHRIENSLTQVFAVPHGGLKKKTTRASSTSSRSGGQRRTRRR